MASRKELKKGVKQFFTDYVEECIFQKIYFDKDFAKLEKLVDEAVEIEEDLLKRINNNKKDKTEFTAIKEDLTKAADKLVEGLNKA